MLCVLVGGWVSVRVRTCEDVCVKGCRCGRGWLSGWVAVCECVCVHVVLVHVWTLTRTSVVA